jgi:hypothetical protein
MTIAYRIYSNNGNGGTIDYSSPASETINSSYQLGSLQPSGHYRFAVRAFDTQTGLEEHNTQAFVEIRLDEHGNDIGPKPLCPLGLSAYALADGRCQVAWIYPNVRVPDRPRGFTIVLETLDSLMQSEVVVTVDYSASSRYYQKTIAGLLDGVRYRINVQAVSANALSVSDFATVDVIGKSSPPDAVEALTIHGIP